MTSNISLYTIPVAWFLSLAPHIYATQLYQSASSRQFDTRTPRTLMKLVADNQTIDAATKNRIIRAESAQQNGFENLGLFAAAVVAGNMARLDSMWLNGLSVGYLISRMVYTLIYINNTTGTLAATRTGVFASGLGMVCMLFVLAGNEVRNLA